MPASKATRVRFSVMARYVAVGLHSADCTDKQTAAAGSSAVYGRICTILNMCGRSEVHVLCRYGIRGRSSDGTEHRGVKLMMQHKQTSTELLSTAGPSVGGSEQSLYVRPSGDHVLCGYGIARPIRAGTEHR